MKSLQLLLLLLLTANITLAETTNEPELLKQYDIEIIIFEDAHARYINSESWHKDTLKEDTSIDDETNSNISKESKVTATNNKPASFEPLKPEMLRKEYKGINISSEYNVLLYSAWRQTGLKEAEAFEIDINELDNAHKNRSENTITGSLKIVLARYLHFYSQLEYKRKENTDTTNAPITDDITESNNKDISLEQSADTETTHGTISYPVISHRRMRSKELHYIDHPLVGILIQINPVKATTPPD